MKGTEITARVTRPGKLPEDKGRRALGRSRQLEPEAKGLPGQGMVQG